MTLKDLRNKHILIMGLGLNGGGLGISNFLLKHGAMLTITDLKTNSELQESINKIHDKSKVKFVLGKHNVNDFKCHDIVIKGAGIKWTNKYIQEALNSNIPVETDIGLFFKLSNNPKIGLTGSKGKSTTTTITYSIFQQINAKLGGNITVSPFENFDSNENELPYILELSSWQLGDLSKTKRSPDISAFTNLIPDHLDYYGNMENYFNDKKNIYKFQTSDQFTIMNFDNLYLQNNIINNSIKPKIILVCNYKNLNKALNIKTNNTIEGILYFINDEYYYKPIKNTLKINPSFKINAKDEYYIGCFKSSYLKGEHNHYNLAIALTISLTYGLNKSLINDGIKSYKGVPYRNNLIFEKNGISFINDTTATIPDAVYATLSSYKNRSVILLAGGVKKDLPIENMIEIILKKCKKVFLFEGSGSEILLKKLLEKGFDNIEYYYSDMKSIITDCIPYCKDGDNLILSPGFASFNLFKNEFDRGNQFNDIVKEI